MQVKNEMMKLPHNWINSLVAILNIIVALLFIVASFSDTVSPAKSLFFAYLGIMFPFFFVLNFCFLIYWLFVRKWMLLFIALCSFLICWKPVTHYVPIHLHKEEVSKDKSLKVLTYNVMCFGYKDHSEKKPNRIVQYILNSEADIVCMQEFMVRTAEGSNVMTWDRAVRVFNMYPYHYHLPLVHYSKYTVGMAIFSKYPILNSWKMPYDSSFNGSTVHEIDVNGKKVIVVNNHLESFKLTMEDRTKYEDFIKNINADTFDGLKETVQRKLGSAFLIRAEQADIVAEEIRNLKGDYIIVCGDFNDTPVSYSYRTIRGPLIDSFEESGNGFGITYNQNFFWFRIDHILHSANMKSSRATVNKFAVSDHYPLWCYLEMN